MRELKFRAWDNNMKRWLSRGEGVEMALITKFVPELSLKGELSGIIEQYTGLKDKNGKEIYEGDIVRWSFKVDRNSEPTYTTDVVKWESYAEEEWPYSAISGFTLPESEDGYEVIGNIHENPELLGDTNVTNKEEE